MPASPDLDALAAMASPLTDDEWCAVRWAASFVPQARRTDGTENWAILVRLCDPIRTANAAPALIARCRELEAVANAAKAWAVAWEAGLEHSFETAAEGATADALFAAVKALARPGPAVGEPKP